MEPKLTDYDKDYEALDVFLNGLKEGKPVDEARATAKEVKDRIDGYLVARATAKDYITKWQDCLSKSDDLMQESVRLKHLAVSESGRATAALEAARAAIHPDDHYGKNLLGI